MYQYAELVHWMNNQETKKILPAQVDIDLTNICNQDCYYCNSAEFRASEPVQKKYTDQLKSYDLTLVTDEMDMLYKIYEAIWNLESELKSGMEAQLELVEIDRRAIEIRNFNNKRIQLKNAIAEKLGCSVREIKAQHISE